MIGRIMLIATFGFAIVAGSTVFGADCSPLPIIKDELPRYERGWSGGVTWHDGKIYEVTDSTNFAIVRDALTGQELSRIYFSNLPSNCKDIAYDPWSNTFWVTSGQYIHQFPLTGGNWLRRIQFNRWMFGIYVDPDEENVIWAANMVDPEVNKINLVDGSLIERVHTTFPSRGVARTGEYLWCSRAGEIGESGVLIKVDMNGNEVCKYFLPQGKYWHDVGGLSLDDEGHLWVHGGKELKIYKMDIGYTPLPPPPPPTPEVPAGELNWYLPGGATHVFDTYILISNPNSQAAEIVIEYHGKNGLIHPGAIPRTVPARSRVTAVVRNDVGVQNPAGTVIRSTNGVGVITERSMYWPSGKGPDGWRGGHNTIGLATTGTLWFLAEGATSYFDQFIHILNPNIAAANLSLGFVDESGAGYNLQTWVPARSVLVVKANDVADGKQALSTVVVSDQPVAVDRAVYFPRGGPANWKDGHASPALAKSSTQWYFAEGATHLFDQYISVFNPSAQYSANLRFAFRDQNGVQQSVEEFVPPNRRATVKANSVIGENAQAVATLVTSLNNVGVMAERAMYHPKSGPGNWELCHATVGARPALNWYLPEGSTFKFNQYVMVLNTSGQTANVQFAFLDAGGNVTHHALTVAPLSRSTVNVNALVPNNTQVSTIVSSDQPVVAERAMYWPRGGPWRGGHTTVGYAP